MKEKLNFKNCLGSVLAKENRVFVHLDFNFINDTGKSNTGKRKR